AVCGHVRSMPVSVRSDQESSTAPPLTSTQAHRPANAYTTARWTAVAAARFNRFRTWTTSTHDSPRKRFWHLDFWACGVVANRGDGSDPSVGPDRRRSE